MYYRIKNDNVYDYSNDKYDDGCLFSDLCTKEEYQENLGKWIIGDVEEEIDVPDYDEEGNPIMIEYEDTEVVIDYDEQGNPIGSHEVTVIKHKQQTHKETIYVKGIVLNPNYEQEEETRRETEFNKAFFNTSLGYIRRSVTMADGSKRDFLADLLLPIKTGMELGQEVEIIAYIKPPFDEDVTDWTQYQKLVNPTPQFIQECLMQTVNDFKPQE